jgi:ABC-2 type transport system permease protein
MNVLYIFRRFWVYAWLSYRALFTWLNPWGYISSRIAMPVMIALLFGSLGRYLGTGAVRPAIGAAMLAVGIATVYGINLAVANERTFGTLGIWLLASQGLLPGLVGKSVVHVVDGILGAALTFSTACLVFSVRFSGSAVPSLLCCAACAAVSSSGLGVAVAAASIRFHDVFTAPNVAESLLLVGSGAVVAPSTLPAHIGAIGTVLPLTHAVYAAHAVLAGAGLPVFQLGCELLIGTIWGTIGYGLLRWMTLRARSTGAYDVV